MEANWHDWKEVDLHMRLADIEAELPDCLASYPAYLPWVMQWAASMGLRELNRPGFVGGYVVTRRPGRGSWF
jgi:hypothetical protein